MLFYILQKLGFFLFVDASVTFLTSCPVQIHQLAQNTDLIFAFEWSSMHLMAWYLMASFVAIWWLDLMASYLMASFSSAILCKSLSITAHSSSNFFSCLLGYCPKRDLFSVSGTTYFLVLCCRFSAECFQ